MPETPDPANQASDRASPDVEALRYCPRLGHDVPLKYCLAPGSEIPCRRLAGCWRGRFDVEAYLDEHLTDQQRRAMNAPAPDKAATLVELIRRAQAAAEKPDDAEPSS